VTEATAGAPFLELDHVSVDFHVRRGFFSTRPVHAVRDVSLRLARGETLALVGESGSGKTTLGRATLHLVPLAAGRVVFDGTDLATLDGAGLKAFRRRAQVIFQDPYASLSPYMRVRDLVEEPLVIHGPASREERWERVGSALEQVRLAPAEEFAVKYPHTLSGGQRQRVSIARAMVLEPEFLLADEPVSMIDASSRAEILYLLADLRAERGLTFLYITHDLASARYFADRIAVMYAGRVVELAPARELVADPKHPYAQGLLAAVPEPDPANRLRIRPVVAGEPPDPSNLPTGCAFHPRCPLAIPGLCDRVDPPLLPVSATHEVACHIYSDAVSGSGDSVGAGVRGGAGVAMGVMVRAGAGEGASPSGTPASGDAGASGVAGGAGDAPSSGGGIVSSGAGVPSGERPGSGLTSGPAAAPPGTTPDASASRAARRKGSSDSG
jgi:oligopeptide/dipeptide ABC transporter ATP-binding protein